MLDVHVNMEAVNQNGEVIVRSPNKKSSTKTLNQNKFLNPLNKSSSDGKSESNQNEVQEIKNNLRTFRGTADNFHNGNIKSGIDMEKLRKSQIVNPGSSDSPTKEFFMRKTEDNFIKNSLSPMKNGRFINSPAVTTRSNFNTYVNVLKTDIIQIDNLIKKYSQILTYYKNPNKNQNIKLVNNGLKGNSTLSSKSSISMSNNTFNFQKKISEIEKNNTINISDYFNKISENSKNLENLHSEFNSRSKDELIYNLSMELHYNRLFISKINDLSFLFNLKNYDSSQNYSSRGLPSSNVYSETMSRFHQLKVLFERTNSENSKASEFSNINTLAETPLKSQIDLKALKPQNTCSHKNTTDYLSPIILRKEESISSNLNEDEDVSKILEFHTVSELLKYETKNNIINHIKRLCIQLNDKAYQIFSNFVSNIAKSDQNMLYKLRKTDDTVENFILIRRIIEDIFTNLEKKNEMFEKRLQEITKENERLNTVINDIDSRDLNSLMDHITGENTKLYQNLIETETDGKVKLYSEITKIYTKLDELTNINQTLKEENKNLQTQINLFTKKNFRIFRDSKGNIITDPNESFEIILMEQFDNMKNAFTTKLNNLKAEINKLKFSSEKEIAKLSDELNSHKSIKELFANQIVILKQTFKN